MKKSKLSGNATKYLLQYSKLSVVFIMLKSSDAVCEVVYTNVEPDVELTDGSSSFYVDLNNDLAADFHFYVRYASYGGYYTSGGIYYIPEHHNYKLRVFTDGIDLTGNSLAGSLFAYGTTFSVGYKALPYALEINLLINSSLNFIGWHSQTMAYSTESFGFTYYGGNWYPEKLDHYLGVRFKDIDENTYYGWIRCDVKDEGHTLVIKDYAYESEPDNPIVAGDTVHYIGINSIENTIEATVYSFGRDIYILTETFKNTEVIICDLKGQEVVRKLLHSKNELINMGNNPAGMYLVTLLNCGKRYDKKIFIE